MATEEEVLELNHELARSMQEQNEVYASLEHHKRTLKRYTLTKEELEPLAEDHRTFMTIGRAFIAMPLTIIRKELQEEIENTENKLKIFEERKGKVDEKIADLNKQMKEIQK